MAAPKSKLNIGGSKAYNKRSRKKVYAPHMHYQTDQTIASEAERRLAQTAADSMKRREKKSERETR